MKWLLILNLAIPFIFTNKLMAKTHPHKKLHHQETVLKKAARTELTSKAAATRHFKSSAPETKALQKTLTFNDRIVRGKHQVPGEGSVTVENEKTVFNLISIRSDFNDRRNEEKQRD